MCGTYKAFVAVELDAVDRELRRQCVWQKARDFQIRPVLRREGRREGGKEGGRMAEREDGREGGRVERGGREGGREDGGRGGEREGGEMLQCKQWSGSRREACFLPHTSLLLYIVQHTITICAAQHVDILACSLTCTPHNADYEG